MPRADLVCVGVGAVAARAAQLCQRPVLLVLVPDGLPVPPVDQAQLSAGAGAPPAAQPLHEHDFVYSVKCMHVQTLDLSVVCALIDACPLCMSSNLQLECDALRYVLTWTVAHGIAGAHLGLGH